MGRRSAGLVLLPFILVIVGACSNDAAPTARTAVASPSVTVPAETTVATPVPSATPVVTPTAVFAIERWKAWHNAGANDWAWVQVVEEIIYVATGPRYVCCGTFSNGPGKVTALNVRTGNELWTFATPSQPFPVMVAGGHAVFGTAAGIVFAVATSTGKQVWQHNFPGVPFQVVPAGSMLIVADGDPEAWGLNGVADKRRLTGRLRGLDPATGEQRWENTVGSFTAFVVPAGDGVIAASSGPTSNSDVALFSAAGEPMWRATLAAISSPPAVSDGAVLLAGANLFKLDLATGKQLWATQPRGGGTFFGPTVQGDTVVAATNAGAIEAHSLTTGSLSALGEFPDSYFRPLDGSPYVVVYLGVFRIDLKTASVSISPVFQPQGSVQSAVFEHGQLFVASFIGGTESPSVAHFLPGSK